jgi:hypothetical protein
VGGIAATYYLSATMSSGTAIAARDSLDVKNSAVTIDYAFAGTLVATFATSKSYAVRWKGLLLPELDQIYTFTVGKRTTFQWENITLFLDNVAILTTGNGNLEYTGTIDLRKSFYYDLEVLYQIGIPTSTAFGGPKVTLSWESSGYRKRIVETISLFADFHIRGSPYTVKISPSSTIGGTSTTRDSGGSLSIATAGVQAAFTVTTRDRFNNLRGVGGDSFSAKLVGSNGNAFGLIQDRYDGSYRILYTAVVSGTYQLSIIVSSQHVIGSPYNVVVMPASRSLQNSPSSGMSLTLVTAGVTGNVVITIKDAFDNLQASPDADNAGLTFFLEGTQIASDSPNCLLEPQRCPSNADNNRLENPKMLLRFAVTKAGKYSLMLKGTSLFDGIAKGAPFDLVVFPNIPCASQSFAFGSGLSLVTAGYFASFFVQARDQFFNKRGQFIGDKFGALLRQTPGIGSNYLDKPVAIKDNQDSTYSGTYVATRSQSNFLWAGLQLPGGLVATFYDGSNRSPVGIRHMPTSVALPKNGGLTAYSFTFSDNFGIKWTGVVRVAAAGLYTFAITVNHQNEMFRLWIDNQEILNSISMKTNSTTMTNTFIFLKQEEIHDVLMDYSSYDLSSNHGIELKWAFGGSDFFLIPTDRMSWNYHVPGSPFTVLVKPTVVCATVSTIRNMAISLATAGKVATFTLQALDEFNNLKETGGDEFRFGLVRSATLPDALTKQQASETDGRNGADDVICALQYLFAGGYQISYTATASGSFALRGRLFQQGGLYGLYFENSNFQDNGQYNLGAGSIPSTISTFQRVDPSIDFDWSVIPPVDLSAAAYAYWSGKKSIGPKYFSARWTGSILSLYTEVYSFIGRAKDGIRVVINGTVVIDAIPLRNAFAIGTISLVADSQYPVQIDYVDYDGAASVQLSWKSRSQPESAVPKEVLFYETTSAMLSRNGDPLKIEPAELCASTSSASGRGLSISTAGYIAKFIIQSRDQFGNLRKLGDRPVYVVKIKSEGMSQRPYDGNVRRISDRNFVGGLTSTFYSGTGVNAFQNPVLVRCDIRPWDVPEFCDRTIDFSRSEGSAFIPGLLPSTFSARWSGSLTNQASGTVTFFATIASGLQEHIRLTIDNEKVIESDAASTSFSGKLNFKGLDAIHDILLEYSAKSANPNAAAKLSLDWKMAGFERQLIPSSRLLPLAGRYEVSYNATVKNIYGIEVNAVRQGGLSATYYDDEFTSNPKTSFIQPSIDFSGTTSTSDDFIRVRTTNSSGFGRVGLSDMNSFSARWKGFLLTTQAGIYDFKIEKGGTDERVRLWVDSILIVDKWTPYLYENTTVLSFSATILLDQGKYYEIEMTYSQHSNNAVARLYAQGTVVSSSNLFSEEPLSGSPFPGLEIIPDVGCSSKSSMRGTALSSTTAGATSVFEIQVNDRFYNQRGIGGASLFAEIIPKTTSCFGCLKSYCKIKDNMDSSYTLSYSVGRAGSYKIDSYMAQSGVVELSVFNNSNFADKLSDSLMNSIGFSRSSTGLLPGETNFQNLNCIISGHFNISSPGEYKMMLTLNNFQPLNASFLIGSSTWISNSSNESTASMESRSFSTTLFNELVPFTFKLSSLHLASSDAQAFGISMIDYSMKPTQFSFSFLHKIPNGVDLVAFPDQTCASTSLTNGDGLTVTTAGISATFTITSFDSFANERGVDEDIYITRITTQSGVQLSNPELSSGAKAGRYSVSYLMTFAGNYFINILRPTAGFLNASVFANENHQGIPHFSVMDNNLCPNWGLGRPVPIASNSNQSDAIGIDFVSIRWVGFFAPIDSVPHTFHVTTSDALKLIIQGITLIEKKQEDSGPISAAISVQRGKLYEMTLEYKHVRGSANLCVEMSSTVQARQIFSNNFMYCNAVNVYGSPFSAYSFPSKLCSGTSVLFGQHLHAIQTAGAEISFSIEAKDEYNNHRDVWEESQSAEFNFFVRSRPASRPGTIFAGAVIRNQIPGYFSGRLISTTCGQNSIYASLLSKGAVMATYYGPMMIPVSASTIANSSVACTTILQSILVAGAVRLQSSVTRFYLSTINASLSLNGIPVDLVSKTHQFVANSDIYEFSWLTNCSGEKKLESLDISVGGGTIQKLGINPAIPIYYVKDLSGSNAVVQVLPAICDFFASEKYGMGLTLSTSGLVSAFYIQSRDRFGNKRSSGEDIFGSHVRHVSVLGSHVSSKATYLSGGKHEIRYTVTVQGAYTIDIIFGSSVVQTDMYNMAGFAEGTLCVANSEFLSVATAGHNFEFWIQSKDAYRNLRTLSGENWYVSLKRNDTEEHSVKVDYIGDSHGLAYGLGKYKGSYRTTTSGAFSLSVNMVQKTGLLRVIFSDTSFTLRQQVSQVQRVDFNWGTNGPLSNASLLPDYFSAKFSGFLKSETTGIHTFFISVADANEAATLKIAHQVVLNSALYQGQSEFSGTIDLISKLLYPIELSYSETSGSASVILSWQKGNGMKVIVPESVFYSDLISISGSPFKVTVFPAMVCGSLSIASGTSLSIVTAGTAATFTITSKDYMGNSRSDSQDKYIVFTRANTIFPTMNADKIGTVIPQGNGQYVASFQADWKQNSHGCVEQTSVEACMPSEPWPSGGSATHNPGHPFHELHVQQLFQGGMMATYYADDSNEIFTPRAVGLMSMVNFSCTEQSSAAALKSVSAVSFTNVKIAVQGFIDVRDPIWSADLVFQNAENKVQKGDLYLDNVHVIKFPSVNSSKMNFQRKIYTVHWQVIQSKTSSSCSSLFGLQNLLNASNFLSGHQLNFKISEGGSGLSATYYADQFFSSPVISYVSSELPIWNGTDVTSRPHPQVLPIGDFSVRWRGFIKITKEGLYTISMQKGSASESFALSLDGIDILDSNFTATSLIQTGTYYLPANYETKYDIDITYVSRASSIPKAIWAGIKFSGGNITTINEAITEPRLVSDRVSRNDEQRFDWKNGCTGSAGSLTRWTCRGRGTRFNQYLAMKVLPNDAVSVFSSTSGRQLTISTAGIHNYFTVTLRDRFKNQRDDDITVSAFIKENSKIVETARIQSHNDRGPGLLATYYNDFRSTNQMMLTSSYYNSPFMSPIGESYARKQTNLFAFEANSSSYLDNKLDFDGHFAVSMRGFLRAPISGNFSFEYACSHSSCQDVFVWIDDTLVLTKHIAQLPLLKLVRNNFYEIRVLYMSSRGVAEAVKFSLKWDCKFDGCLNVTTRDIFPHSNDNYKKSPLGQHQGQYRLEKSGSYDISVALASPIPGLRACFFLNPNMTTLVRCLMWNEAGFDLSNSSPIEEIAHDNLHWSVSLEGWYQPDESESVVLFAQSNGNFELHFDGKNCSSTCSLTMDRMKHHFFKLFLYPVEICKPIPCKWTPISTFKMFQRSSNGTEKPLSPDRFKSDVEAISVTPLLVYPARACAETSSVHGTCLSLVTAGIASTMTIQIRDEFLNLRTQENDLNYIVEVSIKKFPVSNQPSAFATCIPGGESTGKHLCSYTITRAQASLIDVYLNFESGLEATYYDDSNFLSAKASYNQQDLSFLHGSTAPTYITNDGRWSANFEGSIRSPRSSNVSFEIDCESDEWASVDIDGMNFLNTKIGVTAGSIKMNAGNFYKIFIRYSSSGNASWFFKFHADIENTANFGPVPKYRLYASRRLKGSPFISEVRAAVACSSKSLVDGMGVTLSTAGLIATFKITSRDEFSNVRSWSCLKCHDNFYVRLMGCGRVPASSFSEYPFLACPQCINCPILVRAAILNTTNSAIYDISYTPTKTGSYRAMVSLANDEGVWTSFFDNKSMFCANQIDCNSGDQKILSSNIDFSSSGSFAGKALSSFAFRWRGLIRSKAASDYTFSVSTVNGSATSVNLWIDNQIVLSSSTTAIISVGTVALRQESGLFDFQLTYVAEHPTVSAGLTLKWKSGQSNFEVIPASMFVQRHDIPILALHLVQPNIQSPKVTYAYGSGLSIATSGTRSFFTVASRDQFQNNRLSITIDEIRSEIRGSMGFLDSNVAVTYLNDNKVKVAFTITKASAFDLVIQQLGVPIFESPFPLIVTPSIECASKSFALGSGLSWSRANSMASFVVQVRDSFGNLKTSPISTSGGCQAVVTVNSLLATGEVDTVTLNGADVTLCKNVAVTFFGGTLFQNGYHAEGIFDSSGTFRMLSKGKYVQRNLPFALKGKAMNTVLVSKISYTSNGPIFETSGTPSTQVAVNAITIIEQMQKGALVILSQPLQAAPGQYSVSYTLTSKPTTPMKAFMLPYLLNMGGLIATYFSLSSLAASQNFNNLSQATPCFVTFVEQSMSNIPAECSAPYGIRYFGFVGFAGISAPANVKFIIPASTTSYVRMFWRSTPADLTTSGGVPLGNTWTSLTSDAESSFSAQLSWSTTRTTGYDDFMIEIRSNTLTVNQNGFPSTIPATPLHAPWPLASWPSSLTVV